MKLADSSYVTLVNSHSMCVADSIICFVHGVETALLWLRKEKGKKGT